MQKIEYMKSDIRNYVVQLIKEKIEKLSKYIEFTTEASREIKKTPKYDIIREGAQEEIYQMQKQLAELNKLLNGMTKVVNTRFDTVQLGSLVVTNKVRFYISVSLGEFFFEGDRFYAISEESPMAQIMLGKNEGDDFILNNIHQKIEEIL